MSISEHLEQACAGSGDGVIQPCEEAAAALWTASRAATGLQELERCSCGAVQQHAVAELDVLDAEGAVEQSYRTLLLCVMQ